MKKAGFFKRKLFLLLQLFIICFLFSISVYAQQDIDEEISETQQKLEYAKKTLRKLEADLRRAEDLLHRAIAGQNTKDLKIREENKQAEKLTRSAIADNKRAIETQKALIQKLEAALKKYKSSKKCDPLQLQEQIGKLRGEVKVTQEALMRLNRTIQLNNSQLNEWAKTTDEACKRAWDRGIDMMTGKILDKPLKKVCKKLNRKLGQVEKEAQRAADKLAGEIDPNLRKKLQAEHKLIHKERMKIKENLLKYEQIDKDAAKIVGTVNWALSESKDFKKCAEGIYMLGKMVLEDPEIQKAMGITKEMGEKYFKGLEAGKLMVESIYDATAVCVSWKMINQMDKNSVQFLDAVKALSSRMKTLWKQIKEKEKLLEECQE